MTNQASFDFASFQEEALKGNSIVAYSLVSL
jgi:hypothetical protein